MLSLIQCIQLPFSCCNKKPNFAHQNIFFVSKLLNELNEAQQQAVIQKEGPIMIIAGAGSGKTRALTYRVAYLIEKGVDPFNILALTFTNKAAREMKERVMQLVGNSNGRNVWMGTFHAIFARILRIDGHLLGYPSNFTIYDTDDSKRLIKAILKDQNLDPKVYTPSFVLHRISGAKSNLFTPDDYKNNTDIQTADAAAGKPLTGELFRTYNARLKRANAMDFDDLLFNTNVLFRDYPEILYKYQHKFKYVLVDEYQDTNHAQYLIVKRLVALNENLCVVGDDAQSIYGFRGANIQNILNFRKDYPDHKLFRLEQNYRSTKNIVNAANEVIDNNRDQIKKTVWTDRDQGELISLLRASSDGEEGTLVANSIFGFKMSKQLPNSHFAILYRTNAQSRSMEEALRKQGIPYRIYGGLSFYSRKEVKDLLAYFRLVINHNDEEAFQRIINYPARGIGKTTIEKMLVLADQQKQSLWETACHATQFQGVFNRGAMTKIEEFTTMIKSFRTQLESKNAYDLARHITLSVALLKTLKEDDSPEGISRIENIEELLNAIKEFTESEAEQPLEGEEQPPFKTLGAFMKDVALLTDADKNDPDNKDYVSLMTIHASKGLEFPYVYIVGLEENLFPSIQSLATRAELEEERRLFYVALTRAEEKVTLSFAESRYRWGNLTLCEPSRFIEEINPEFIEQPKRTVHQSRKLVNPIENKPPANLKRMNESEARIPAPDMAFDSSDMADLQNGMKVMHQKFGKGKVIALEGEGPNKKATVYFSGIGNKQLLLKFAKLKILD
jgi:DNA helicase II / ATP-dependent DNA helicase PcrA